MLGFIIRNDKYFELIAEVSTERPVIELDWEESRDDVQVVIDNLPPELDSDQQAAGKKFIHDCTGLFSK